jgi:60 kDa SS-A/Ro ribonucleoprotein
MELIMARFNVSKKGSTKTVNHEGAPAYTPTAKLELMLRTMSFMMSGGSYYEKEKDTSAAIAGLVKSVSKKDPEFVLRLAAFARNEMYLRTVPIFLAVEYAKTGTKLKNAYKYIPQILKRADEPAEALAYYFKSSGSRKIPAMLKKGIAETLNNFDEYQFGKWNRKGTVTLKDVLFLTHPKPKSEEQQKLFDKITTGTLDTPFTWETHISKNGSSKETWEQVIPNMGYMATLRNLRNCVEQKVDLAPVIKKLTDPKAVANSKQFPYRFFSAYKALAYNDAVEGLYVYATRKNDAPTKLLDAVNDAMDLSVSNIPKIPGKTFVASDNSGSMNDPISSKSNVERVDISSLFSAISMYICDDAKVSVFATTYERMSLSKRSSILDNMEKIRKKDVGGSTNAWLAIQDILDRKEYYDRIFLFSDMQCYNTYGYGFNRDDSLAGLVNKYRKEVNPNCRLYSFDVGHYGLLKFPENDPLTCPVAGYSDTIFRFVPMFEENRETMLKSIESYPPSE